MQPKKCLVATEAIIKNHSQSKWEQVSFWCPAPSDALTAQFKDHSSIGAERSQELKKKKKESVERISIGEMSENISMKYHQYDCLNKHWTRTIPIHFPPWLLGRWGYFLWCFNRNLKVVKSDRSRRKYCSPEESSQIAYPIQ